jgi:Domain of unknown function (DUF4347)/FG-GAP-like repeat
MTSTPLNILSSQATALLFIDLGVPDWQTLAAAATPGTEVHVLDPEQDAIQQITDALQGRSGIRSLQIVSHGAPGSLHLGQDQVTTATFQTYAEQLASWQTALTADADILLYGCNVAEGELGQAFVQTLSQLTGTDVAASTDLTGSSALGGDWTLEYQAGEIESSLAIRATVLQAYRHTLELTFTVQTGAADPFNGVDVGSNSAPSFADLDGDGDTDALIGAQDGTLRYYRNTGSTTNPVFTIQTGVENPFDGVDVGGYSAPSFADLDGDGDTDALIGVEDGTLRYYRNTGSATNPVFTAQTGVENPFNGVDVGSDSTPSFADLDGDGDADAVIGAGDGTLRYYRNTGSTTNPVFTAQTGVENPFNGVDVGLYSTPSFADLDGDGDADAVIGENDGTLRYYRNTGSTTNPVFTAQTGAANPFNGVNLGSDSTPSFADLDGDGDAEALIGARDGTLRYYRSTGGVTITQSGTTVITEGGATDNYTVVLNSKPTSDVTITLNNGAQTSTSPTTLTFTAANWNVAQTVTVTALNDSIVEGSHSGSITHTATSSDANYNGITIASVSAAITDNDTAGVTITQSGGTTAITEGSATDSYTVVLTSQPTSDVTITLTNGTQTSTNPTSLTFTAANWNVAQTVTVTAVNDAIAEGNHTGSITHTASSTDANYNGITIGSVSAAITDNDSAGVTITQSGGTTAITEGGATDTYTVVLNSQPTGDVTITLNNGAQTSTSPTSLTFTAANWNVAQTVTVTAVNDAIAEGSHSGSITHTATSADTNYNGITIGSVSAAITDNEPIVSLTAGTNPVEGTTGTYILTLDRPAPVSGLTINYTLAGTATPADYTLTAGTNITAVTGTSFTIAAGQTTAILTVNAISDGIADGVHR